MTRTMIAYKTGEFEHKEVGSIFYRFSSRMKEWELARKLCVVNNGHFVVILGNENEPLDSLEIEKG